ncbi:ankyrin repeat and zinc finger domain-containing protein 1 isoform X2 [Hyla sarda]|uniref:ankyrin repeat and zinc finger domain-containing protein 1 isoform X2 n=1 Tax=Hyla sarda TaxID=327740 RepID=UPI0024C25466|nr:ankyrin repeat and zinc finger domain-containing protein 1 isoform X2 [Hyla sarda]
MEGSAGIQAMSLFDLSPSSPLLSGLFLNNNANGKDDSTEEKVKPPPEITDREAKAPNILEISDRMTCLTCQCTFDTREDQKEHYTLDWHRFNLKRRIRGAAALSEEDFQEKTQAGDVSSISGSDSESSDELETETTPEPSTDPSPIMAPSSRAQRVLFRNGEQRVLSVYRCVLGLGKDTEVAPEHLLSCVKRLQEQPVVVILMAGGGHFAGAVYKGKEALQHKTFHRYTVRAKRGSAQSVHDAQNRGHMAKSAGAALRRYNQAALVADINQLLQSWAEHIKEAQSIFLRAPRSDKTLFLGRNSPITRKDPRVFGIPFVTRRATFREVHRVHSHLFTLQLYEKDALLLPIRGTREKSVKSRKSVRTGIQEETADVAEVSEEESPPPGEYVEEELTISTLDLREHEVQPKRRRKKKKKRDGANGGRTGLGDTSQRSVPDPVDEDSSSEETENRTHHLASALEGDDLCRIRNVLFTCCKTGDTETAKQILQELLPGSSEDSSVPRLSAPEVLQQLVNEHLAIEKRTLLHVAAAAGQGDMARLLMDAGWDPSLRDSAAQTPYSVSTDKRTRNSFRKYREENPDKYNYSKSQIPGPILEEVEARKTEKKRAQRAQRKQKEKEEKEERLKREAEEAEKKRFAALSDREKRAIAAERRLAAQLTEETAGINVRRCWQCGASLLGKIPFEYLEFSFCTTRCLQEHRRNQAAKSQK